MLFIGIATIADAREARITRAIDTTQVLRLQGSLHPLVKSRQAQAHLSGSTILNNVAIVFKRSPAQQKALDTLLIEQQDPKSPEYHHWLSPKQFGNQFGLAPVDIDKIKSWLKSQGLTVGSVDDGRTQISFSGTVTQVEAAFHTEMDSYLVDGEKHFANAIPLSIPAALADVVLSVRNLNDFRPKPLGIKRHQKWTNTQGSHYLAPEDLGTIYDIKSLYGKGLTGAGQILAVVGTSEITMSNIEAFRSRFGLLPNDPTEILVPNTGNATVSGDQDEAYLDLEWAGGVAPNATIDYVYVGDSAPDGVFDAALYAIQTKLAPIISMSFGICEPLVDQSTALSLQTYAQQANAQGQTIVAASGDAGAAACEHGKAQSATQGLAVNLPASIPEVTAVGGSEFTGDPAGDTTYWSNANDGSGGSSLSYIPEEAWNDTALSISAGGGLLAGGGASSIYFPLPTWQTGSGVPSSPVRYVPDISLTASPNHDGYILCTGTASCDTPIPFGGTSAAAPSFAGILAILNQATGSSGLGNINPSLYLLATNSPTIFHDITAGDNKVPCTAGSTDCPNGGSIGYSAGVGYDEATGLGSIDAGSLVANWRSYYVSTNPASVTIASAGQSATAQIMMARTGGYDGTVNLSCTVSSSTAKMGCTLSSSSIPPGSGDSSTVSNLTITTTAPTTQTSSLRSLPNVVGLGMVFAVGLVSFSSRFRRTLPLIALAVLLPMIGIVSTGCGGTSTGSKSTPPTTTTVPGTPTGNYTVTIAATDGTTTKSTTMDVNVQ